MYESTESRRQSFHNKKQKKKKAKYAVQTHYTDNTTAKEFKIRSSDNIADHKLTIKYGVSFHACHRFLQRVFGQTGDVTFEDVEKAAAMIVKNVPHFKEVGEGRFPLFDDYIAVVRAGIVITILNRKGK